MTPLEAKIQELEKYVEELECIRGFSDYSLEVGYARDLIKALRALEFYADKKNYGGYHRDYTQIMDDDVREKDDHDNFEIVVGGLRARQAIAEIVGEG